jgi:hypothetical protein
MTCYVWYYLTIFRSSISVNLGIFLPIPLAPSRLCPFCLPAQSFIFDIYMVPLLFSRIFVRSL